MVRYKRLSGEKVWIVAIPDAIDVVTSFLFNGIGRAEHSIENWILCLAAQDF